MLNFSHLVIIVTQTPHILNTQSLRAGVTSGIAAASKADADVQLSPGDTLKIGSLSLTCLATPGHTNGCMSFYLPAGPSRSGLVFTGTFCWCGCTMLCQLVCVVVFDS